MSNPLFTEEDLRPGRRVELHPATDEWMKGDRYGTIRDVVLDDPMWAAEERAEMAFVVVDLDRSGRPVNARLEHLFRVFD